MSTLSNRQTQDNDTTTNTVKMTQTPKSNPARETATQESEHEQEIFHDARFPPDEEAVSQGPDLRLQICTDQQRLLEESHAIKSEANALFTSTCYDQAISSYDRALASCPNYLDYEVAVLKSNVAACYLKLKNWKEAVEAATACIDSLERSLPSPSQSEQTKENEKPQSQTENKSDDAVIEISGDDEAAEQAELTRLRDLDTRKRNVTRIRTKALLRRAHAKTELGGWGNLQGAEEDYKTLSAMENLSTEDRKVVMRALRELPPKIGQAREKEVGEMMGKLKDVSSLQGYVCIMLT